MLEINALVLQNIWPIITGAVSLVAILLLWWLQRHFVTWKAYDVRISNVDRRLGEHAAKLEAQGERTAELEGALKAITATLEVLPRREDILRLEGGLREIKATMEGVKTLKERQEKQINMLTEHLLEK